MKIFETIYEAQFIGEYNPKINKELDLYYEKKTPFILLDLSEKIADIPSALYNFPKSYIDDLTIYEANLPRKDLPETVYMKDPRGNGRGYYVFGLFNHWRTNLLSNLICFANLLSNFGYHKIKNNFNEFYIGVKEIIESNKDFELIDFFRNPVTNEWFDIYFKGKAETAKDFWNKFIMPTFSFEEIFNSHLFLLNITDIKCSAITSPFLIISANNKNVSKNEIKWIAELSLISKIHNAIENNEDIRVFIIEDEHEIINIQKIWKVATEFYPTNSYTGNIHLITQIKRANLNLQKITNFSNSEEKCHIIKELTSKKHGTSMLDVLFDACFRLFYDVKVGRIGKKKEKLYFDKILSDLSTYISRINNNFIWLFGYIVNQPPKENLWFKFKNAIKKYYYKYNNRLKIILWI